MQMIQYRREIAGKRQFLPTQNTAGQDNREIRAFGQNQRVLNGIGNNRQGSEPFFQRHRHHLAGAAVIQCNHLTLLNEGGGVIHDRRFLLHILGITGLQCIPSFRLVLFVVSHCSLFVQI